MIQKRILFFCFLCIAQAAFAQKEPPQKRGLGIENGLTLGFMDRFGPFSMSSNYSNSVRKGYMVNLFGFCHLHPYIRLHVSIGYTGYGGYFHKTSSEQVVQYYSHATAYSTRTIYHKNTYRLDYVESTCLLKFMSTPYRQNSPYFTVGVSNGILIYATQYHLDDDFTGIYDLNPASNRATINGILGFGAEFGLRKSISFGFDARLHFGLSSTFKYDKWKDARRGVAYSIHAKGYIVALAIHLSKNF